VKKSISIFLIVAAVCASYAPALRDEFVWDDNALVLRDPLIRSWRLIPEGFQHFLFTDATASDFYRPIQRLTYTLEYAAFTFRPAAYHLTSIICHAAAAVALFLLVFELLNFFGVSDQARRWIALLATIAWAIHPVHTAAVVYVSGRADPLAALFGFLGLYFGLRSLRAIGNKVWWWMLAMTLAFVLTALSKEAGLIFPLLWMSILALKRNWHALLRATIAAVFVVTVYLSLRLPAEHVPPPPPQTQVPLLVRPILIARACAEYAGLIVLPIDLHMDRDVETHPYGFNDASLSAASLRELQTLLGILLIAVAIYWAVRARKNDPALFAFLLLTAICYLPVSGIFLLNATVAEHWLYLPTAFLFPAIALAVFKFFAKANQSRSVIMRGIVGTALICWILFLGGRTFVRTFDWKDQRTFLERTIAHGGDSARMLINLAGLESSRGQLDAAKGHLEIALRKEPGQPFAMLSLAGVAIKQNDFKFAHELLAHATQMPAVEAQAQEDLVILEGKETGNANLMRMRLAARTGPPNWAIEKRYVKLLVEAGYLDHAITEMRTVVGPQWYRAESWQLFSELLTKAGQSPEAADALERAKAYDVHLADHPSGF
jgi:protein O-mannosyl-transferase